MIKHIVFWKLKEENKAENAAEMARLLRALPEKVPGIIELEVGDKNIQSGDAASDISLYTSFNSLADLEAYQVHPEHQKVVAFVKDVVSERRVVDYEA